MRLYVSVEDPSETLKTFANFISTVYAPGWFIIKMNPEAIRGPKNLHKILQLCGELPENVLAIIKPVVQETRILRTRKTFLSPWSVITNHTLENLAGGEF